jgi:hypothetical protein
MERKSDLHVAGIYSAFPIANPLPRILGLRKQAAETTKYGQEDSCGFDFHGG